MEENRQKLPAVAMRGVTFLPGMNTHFDVSRPRSVAAVERAMLNDQRAFLVTQRELDVEEPSEKDLFTYGTVVRIKQLIKMPNKIVRVLAEGLERAKLLSLEEELGCLYGEVEPDEIVQQPEDAQLAEAMLRELQGQFRDYMELGPRITKEMAADLRNSADELTKYMHKLAIYLPVDYEMKQRYLEAETIREKYTLLSDVLRDEIEVQTIEQELSEQVKARIDRNQREYVLREHQRLIQEELGEDQPDDIEEYERKLKKLRANKTVKEKIKKEIQHLKMVSQSPSENAVMRTYIETLLDMPWDREDKDSMDLVHAKEVLDEDHYGLDKVKDRVLEFLAVRILTKKGDSPILCLVGPPGTGKTSVARSVARALGKKYVRICLGGVRDEAEIRGHRKTYVGAMPGRIAAGLKSAGVKNPLMLLDEIDKLGNDFRGDPSSALLEVLDSEQNSQFNDHYIEIPVDLSEVLFIATANNAQTIPKPLLDRMEIIEVNSYTANEKLHIARRHLIPKQMQKNGLSDGDLVITDGALAAIIECYTKEAGVRSLERRIAEVCRKTAREIIEKGRTTVKVSQRNLEQFLGKAPYRIHEANRTDEIGIVRGLAWTSVGGETLQIEVNVMPGGGECLLTGQLGDVMKESAQTGISYIRSISGEYKIAKDFFQKHDIHIHIPEGAVPKDGPSAGITMATAILSAVTDTPVRHDVAMTGEITLRGRVLPIGGLKEKLLAAKAAGITTVLVPAENRADVEEMEKEVIKGLRLIYVETMREVISQAFVNKE